MTTPLTGQDTRCPQCSASLADDPRFTVWCPSCHWNALPEAQAAKAAPVDTLRRRLDQSLEQRLFQEATSGADLKPHRDAAAILGALLALPVHLVSLAALLGAAWLATFGHWVAYVGALGLLGIAWQGRPRLGSLRKSTKKQLTVDRTQAPQLWALADAVADELGTSRAAAIVLDARHNASYGRRGLRRRALLRLGLPLWHTLNEQERVALLAHEFGHGANGDFRRSLWLGAALDALQEWHRMLHPGRTRTAGRGLEALIAMLTNALLFVFAQLVLLYARLLYRITRISSRRAEYLADSYTVRLAGREGAVGLVEGLGLHTAFETIVNQRVIKARSVPRQRRGAAAEPEAQGQPKPLDLWEELRGYVASIPAAERSRRMVVAELTHDNSDGTHPPLHLRHAFVAGLPAGEPAIRLDAATAAAIDAELRPIGSALAKRLLDR